MSCQLLNGKVCGFEIHQTKWQHKIMEGDVWPRSKEVVFLCKKQRDKVWETIIWYLVRYLSFTSVRTASEANGEVPRQEFYHAEDAASYPQIRFVPCSRLHKSGPPQVFTFLWYVSSRPVSHLRCVCTFASLRLPAIPKRQADQTRIPDTLLPRGLSCRRHGLPDCDLSHLYRYAWISAPYWEVISTVIFI